MRKRRDWGRLDVVRSTLAEWGLRGGSVGVRNCYPAGCQQPKCIETSSAANRELRGLDRVRTRRVAGRKRCGIKKRRAG